MDICRVRSFLAVCGSFSAAAKACGVSQPAVTTAVRRLERDVGGRLFERWRPVRLTELGVTLRPLLEELRSASDRLAAEIQRQPGDEAGSARTGILGRATGYPNKPKALSSDVTRTDEDAGLVKTALAESAFCSSENTI